MQTRLDPVVAPVERVLRFVVEGTPAMKFGRAGSYTVEQRFGRGKVRRLTGCRLRSVTRRGGRWFYAFDVPCHAA